MRGSATIDTASGSTQEGNCYGPLPPDHAGPARLEVVPTLSHSPPTIAIPGYAARATRTCVAYTSSASEQ
jgi:hypothetical protein